MVKSQVRQILATFCKDNGVSIIDDLILNYWQDILLLSSGMGSQSLDGLEANDSGAQGLYVEDIYEMIFPLLADLCCIDGGGTLKPEDVAEAVQGLSEQLYSLLGNQSPSLVDSAAKHKQQLQHHHNHRNNNLISNKKTLLNITERKRPKSVSLEHHFTKGRTSSLLVANASLVDAEKLAKAEAKLKLKQEKKLAAASAADSSSTTASGTNLVESAGNNLDWMAWLMATDASSSNSAIGDLASANARDIKIDDFDIGYPGRPILKSAAMTLAHGRRYGLVGRNGEGKSTLLKALAAREIPVPKNCRILLVEQEVVGDETSAIQSVLQADYARTFLLEKEKELLTKLSSVNAATTEDEIHSKWQRQLRQVYRRLEEIEADRAEAKASAILTGLGFSAEAQLRPTRTFSGGWRMRLSLAQSLLTQPDLLLLDEPTNMLDLPAVAWLERYLTTEWKNTLLVVSHDRLFLSAVTTDIIHLHHGLLDAYKGDYEVFVATKDERLRHQQREYENQLQYRQHLQSFIDRWRYNAKRASQAQSKMKILEKLPDLKPVSIDAPIRFRFPDCESLSPPLLQMSDIWFRYPAVEAGGKEGEWLLKSIHFDLTMDSRIALVGANGCGKTTFLKVMIGKLEPQQGFIFRHNRLRFAYFSQYFIDQLDLRVSAMEYLMRLYPRHAADEIRTQLGSMGLSGNLALQTMGTLSGGQKSRVAFTMLCLQSPHILILDEPSNHLDMDSIVALSDALDRFNGGVIVVSHDEAFINKSCREIWLCKDASVTRFDGSIKDYKKTVLSQFSAPSLK